MSNLKDLRRSLDNIDSSLVYLLAERFSITKKVGVYKKAKGLPIVDSAREAEQARRIAKLARQAGLDKDFAQRLLRLIIDEVVKNHEALRKKTQP